MTSNSNSTTPGTTGAPASYQFATLHGTLSSDAGLGGSGSYVTAAENGGTRQSGNANTTGHTKLNAAGVEGSFSLTPIIDGGTGQTVGHAWSGSRTTTRDSGNSTASHGGHVSVDENGNITATGLTNSEAGGGTQETVTYGFSGSYQEYSPDNVSYTDHQRTDAFTTTSHNSAAAGNLPATKSSTDTHQWNEANVDASIDTTSDYTAGNASMLTHDWWDRLEDAQVDRSQGTHTTTVTLAGDNASANISLTSHHEAGHEWDKAWRHDDYSGTSPNADDEDERIDHGFETGSTLAASREQSDYSSRHTVDAAGHAHGGKFSAHREQVSLDTSRTDKDYYTDGAAADEYVFDQHETSFTETATYASTTTDESGSYQDLVLPFGIAIRVQMGTYDTTEETGSFTRTGSDGHTPWSNSFESPAVDVTTHSSTTSTDSQTRTTHGWYNPFFTGETSEFRRDYQETIRSSNTADYLLSDPRFQAHSNDRVATTIHIGPDAVRGTRHPTLHALLPPTPGVPYDIDETTDLFAGQTPPTPPKNPLAGASHQVLAAQDADGEGSQPADPALADYWRWREHRAKELGFSNAVELDAASEAAALVSHPVERKPVKTEKIESFSMVNQAAADRQAMANWLPGNQLWNGVVQIIGLPEYVAAKFHDGLTASDPSYIDHYADGSYTYHMGEGPTTTALANEAMLFYPLVPGLKTGRPAGTLKFAEPETVTTKEVVTPSVDPMEVWESEGGALVDGPQVGNVSEVPDAPTGSGQGSKALDQLESISKAQQRIRERTDEGRRIIDSIQKSKDRLKNKLRGPYDPRDWE